jgi:hypothetical protein
MWRARRRYALRGEMATDVQIGRILSLFDYPMTCARFS